MSLTTMLFGAKVRILDAGDRRAEAIAWRDGLVLAVGTEREVRAAAGPEVVAVDLAGAAVLPGFVDAHQHPGLTALYGGLVRLAPPDVTDLDGLLTLLARASRAMSPDRWLVAMDWDEAHLRERRGPTRAELDAAVPDRPVFALHYTCHRAVANSRALALAGIDAHTPEPSGGSIGRGRGGLPDGLLVERGMSRVERLARASLIATDADGFFERLALHHAALLGAGITRVADATVPGDLGVLYREAARRGAVRVPTILFPVATSGYLETPWEALEGSVTGTVEGPLTVGPVKLVFDGAPVCSMCLSPWQMLGASLRTMALVFRQRSLDPLRTAGSVRPRFGRDLKVRSGIAIYSQSEALPIVRAAAERGFRVATHAIGNEAVGMALSAYEAAGPSVGRAGMPRLEHAAFLDRELVKRVAASGAAVVTQPHFVTIPAAASAPSIPGIAYLPHRWLLDAGVPLAGSSDHPVASFAPLDGLRSAVERRDARGVVSNAGQGVSLDEALAMYTRTAAQVCGCLDRCGTLEIGKRADIVVLTGPLERAEHLRDARVRATILGGEVVHGRV